MQVHPLLSKDTAGVFKAPMIELSVKKTPLVDLGAADICLSNLNPACYIQCNLVQIIIIVNVIKRTNIHSQTDTAKSMRSFGCSTLWLT